jgi:hypothetical protein
MTNEAGLQFSGEPTELALSAQDAINDRENTPYDIWSMKWGYTIIKALELMAGEKK